MAVGEKTSTETGRPLQRLLPCSRQELEVAWTSSCGPRSCEKWPDLGHILKVELM